MKALELIVVLWAGLVLAGDEPQIEGIKFDGKVHEFVWCGANHEIVLIRTDDNEIYIGKDQTYKKLKNSNELGEIVSIVKSDVDNKTVVLIASDGSIWASNDCGSTLSEISEELSVQKVKLHPTERDWIIASSTDDNGYTLHFTRDMGKHWETIVDDIVQFEWPFNSHQIASGIPSTRVYALTRSGEFVLTDDFFGNITLLAKDITKFMMRSSYLFAVTKMNELLVGNANNKFGGLVTALFPDDLFNKGFIYILDTSQGAVFVLLTRSANEPFGNLYVSDSSGTQFSLSLENCIKDSAHGADFTSVEGLEGIYVANVLSKEAAREYEKQQHETSEEEWQDQEKKQEGRTTIRKKSPVSLIQNNMQTLISFNKGGSWRYLKSPKANYKRRQIHCAGNEECSLHLFIKKGTVVPLYSHKNARGIILANGNIGKALTMEYETRNVYISRDGGLTWREIINGPHIYDIADHGGILAIMELNVLETISFRYSLNEGESWGVAEIPGTNGTVIDIFTEPNSVTKKFLAHIEFTDDSESAAKYSSIFSIDFDHFDVRKCKGETTPGAKDSDYEFWTPHDGRHGEKCLMGRQVTYVRRKYDAECYGEQRSESEVSVENCQCTEDDYECDFGYTRENLLSSGPCVSILNVSQPSCSFGKNYIISSGYRKIPGDTCKDGVLHNSITIICSQSSISKPMLAIIVIVAIAIVFVIKCTIKGKKQKEKNDDEKTDEQTEEELKMNIE